MSANKFARAVFSQENDLSETIVIPDNLEVVTPIIELAESVGSLDDASTDLDKLVVAATALANIADEVDANPSMDSETAEMAGIALAAVAETISAENFSLESISDSIRTVAKAIYEAIKRFFIELGRAFGLFRTKAETMLLKVNQTLVKLERIRHNEGNIRIAYTLGAVGFYALYKADASSTGRLSNNISGDVLAGAALANSIRNKIMPTLKSTVRDLLAAHDVTVVSEAVHRLIIPEGTVAGSMLGSKRIAAASNGYSYKVSTVAIPHAEASTVLTFDVGAIVDILKACKTVLAEFVRNESSHAHEAREVENQLLKLTDKATRTNNQKLLSCVKIMKDTVKNTFEIESAVISSTIGVANIFTRR